LRSVNEHYVHASPGFVVTNGALKRLGGGETSSVGRKFIPKRQSVKKLWLPNRARRKMVLGDDLGLEEVVNLALNALVGRFSYRSHCTTPLLTWMKSNWSPLLGYTPELFFLPRGWFGFSFHSTDDVVKILGRLWPFDGGSLMLKRWRISFDPAQDYFQFRHLWVLLPGLPLNLWNKKALTTIGNALGRFICVDDTSSVCVGSQAW
jgi:hypothetical protein